MNKPDPHQAKNILDSFEEKFANNDLNGFIDFFAEDAVYVEYNGKINKGKKEIRRAFKPLFRGDYGKITFEDVDYIESERGARVVTTWWCVFEFNRKKLKFKGVDVYHIENGLFKEKCAYVQTYAYSPKYIPQRIILFPRFISYIIIRKIKNICIR